MPEINLDKLLADYEAKIAERERQVFLNGMTVGFAVTVVIAVVVGLVWCMSV